MLESFVASLNQRFGDRIENCQIQNNQVVFETRPADLIDVCQTLRDESDFSFQQLSDLCAVDYSTYGQADWDTQQTTRTGFSRAVNPATQSERQEKPQQFAVIYHLLSLQHNRRLRIRCYVEGEPPKLPSVIDIWASANWYEREAFDLFGILFEGHPDLRRILTDYGFIGHPFRKDFPLEGHVEVRYDPDKQRVIYQPVTITNRTLVPRVIRDDNRYADNDGLSNDAKSE